LSSHEGKREDRSVAEKWERKTVGDKRESSEGKKGVKAGGAARVKRGSQALLKIWNESKKKTQASTSVKWNARS